MSTIHPSTLRKAAYLRELASLGCWQSKAATLLGLCPVNVCQLAKRFSIQFPKRPNGSELQKEIARRFSIGQAPVEIAADLGKSTNNVKVTLCKLGLTKGRGPHDAFRYKRGYSVPVELRQEYRFLRRKGLTIREAGYALGLLARPQKVRLTALPQDSARAM